MRQKSLFRLLLPILPAALLALSAGSSVASALQRTFATPQEAAQALLEAAEANDPAAVMNIFGPEADEILNSGDPVEDAAARAHFIERAEKSMVTRVKPPNANRATLLIGVDRFPFPIPLVKSAGRWHFNTAEGKYEILARRIGANELDAIAGCKAYVEAQYDYASEDRNKSGVPEYARKLISSPGKRDGLFWPESDAPPTEFAAKVKEAQSEGYRDEVSPFYHGYYFRILMAQGPKARGGALDYVQHGLMIGGFGLVVWPAAYRVSGVKTFIVNQDGVIYEKDLGRSTGAAARAMMAFNPDSTWQRVR